MKKKFLSLIASLGLTLSVVPTVASAANVANVPQDSQQQALNRIQSLTGNTVKYDVDSPEGKVFLSGKLPAEKLIDESSALNFIDQNKTLFNLDTVEGKLKVEKSEKDELGFTHVKVGQYIEGLPVQGKSVTVHYDQNGQAINVTGDVENKISKLSVLGTKFITVNEAVEIAKKQFSFNKLAYEPKVETIAYIKDGQAYKTYKVNIKFDEPQITNFNVYVEASSGNVINKEDKIRYDGATTGTGIALDGSTKPLNLYLSSGKYQLKDTTRGTSGSQISTYTALNKQTQPGTLFSSTSSTITDKAAVSAHYYAGVVYDFYKNLFDRTSIDDAGMNLMSTVHYGTNYNNAFWDGTQMVYGDGDGRVFSPLCGSLDVVGHEMTHGVTDRTANLTYQDQSGALNESMSDILGVLIETYDKYNVKNNGTWTFDATDWVVGEEVYTPATPGDALRSLANPKLFDQPDTMADYYKTTSDNGGVHTNSGIPNKAGFLVAKAIGCEKTAKIYYRALTQYMTSSTNFTGAKNALLQAATDIYGANSTEANTVTNAYAAVGIGSSTGTVVNVTDVTLNATTATLNVGGTKALTATVAPTNATNKAVTWSSSNTTVATVSSTGLVTAKAVGTATITVTTADGSKTATCKITVSDSSTPTPSEGLSSINEGFDKLVGTSTSIKSGKPSGWTISTGVGVFTSGYNYGDSAPALRLCADGQKVVTPVLSLTNSATLSFYIAGSSVYYSDLLVEKFDGTTWTTVDDISDFSSYGDTVSYTLPQNTKQVRFTYNKYYGNVALDDISIK